MWIAFVITVAVLFVAALVYAEVRSTGGWKRPQDRFPNSNVNIEAHRAAADSTRNTLSGL
ncbi:hypothetical protein [Nocardioides sp. YIM 152588]|uniref:hypothetical protein n=1 Tax=Nocardioides sp. YIM 152588 TaxID=3158259 RepID=UPI0032E3A601